MDLIGFADHTIDIHFRLWQDGAFTLINMFVDDISIPEIGFSDDVESGEEGWISTGWIISDGIFPNGFGMTVFDYKESRLENNPMTLHGVWTMTVDPVTQSGSMMVPATPYKSRRLSIAVCSNHADHIIGQSYTMGAVL